jgi:hypothetical protein
MFYALATYLFENKEVEELNFKATKAF